MHVTKEFGPATLGGLGSVVTSLATVQAHSGRLGHRPAIILPYYAFLQSKYSSIKPHGDPLVLGIPEFPHHPSPPSSLQAQVYHVKHPLDKANATHLDLYLIGPGSFPPFSSAFAAPSPADMYYSMGGGLPQEWQDLYYVAAVAAFLDREAGFLRTRASPPPLPLLVHFHGATVAMTRAFLSSPIPSIYTMHDYREEPLYSLALSSLARFFPLISIDRPAFSSSPSPDWPLPTTSLSPYIHGGRVFPSSLGIDSASAVTFVSKTLAKHMTQGNLTFTGSPLLLPPILRQAQEGYFTGITNGVDLSQRSPFHRDPQLASRGLALSETLREGEIHRAKTKARDALVEAGIIPGSQTIPGRMVLFVGRFQYNKGMASLPLAAQAIKKHGGILVIMGSYNDYPAGEIKALVRDYAPHVLLIDTQEVQDTWGSVIRLAADLAFIPSFTESFGLVAAEALLFGAGVVTTGVGGLREFLYEGDKDGVGRNAWFFPTQPLDPTEALDHAISFLDQAPHPGALQSEWISSALALAWEREQGEEEKGGADSPLSAYLAVYQVALSRSSQSRRGVL
ncbi:hypothetical protein BJ684DRAFT_7843 [Piptocephalis cylindrospora]|uniref:Starch synthase catalytic domain-containing protein n=1 Tax=Piptocephalis cylindrospora TaxID=1907219 RepID=A0A4V1IYL0_9FUNG|nr:hypothetical protein BJ684DRAFT_7843 [Piptocephalis cylindrospora]|eukprot:RKP14929.1 hypothetical protein BJ684DRAFT_7843 [Piptocephalis cylindrospora]